MKLRQKIILTHVLTIALILTGVVVYGNTVLRPRLLQDKKGKTKFDRIPVPCILRADPRSSYARLYSAHRHRLSECEVSRYGRCR